MPEFLAYGTKVSLKGNFSFTTMKLLKLPVPISIYPLLFAYVFYWLLSFYYLSDDSWVVIVEFVYFCGLIRLI